MEFIEWLQGFIESEVLALAPWEPIPFSELTLLIREAHAVRKINGAKPFGCLRRRGAGQ